MLQSNFYLFFKSKPGSFNYFNVIKSLLSLNCSEESVSDWHFVSLFTSNET